jgi:hypothetical protein
MTIEAPSIRGSVWVIQGSPPAVLPEAPFKRVTWYTPLPVATVVGTVPLKTVIVLPGQQGDAPVPTFVPVIAVIALAGVGDSLCTMIF